MCGDQQVHPSHKQLAVAI